MSSWRMNVSVYGPAPAQELLNIIAIISAAEINDAEAIHPGYGFLAENADFAEICEKCGITFIGPSAESMRLMVTRSVPAALSNMVCPYCQAPSIVSKQWTKHENCTGYRFPGELSRLTAGVAQGDEDCYILRPRYPTLFLARGRGVGHFRQCRCLYRKVL
jgi:hypothetical protein